MRGQKLIEDTDSWHTVLLKLLDGIIESAEEYEVDGDLLKDIEGLARSFRWFVPRVVVIGGEGVGKSTLINQILGSAYSPTHANRPATGVPIAFTYQETGDANWHSFKDGGPITQTAKEAMPGVVQYKVAEANNETPDANSVAFVTVANRLLEPKILLIDLPGSEGVSNEYGCYERHFDLNEEHCKSVGILDGAFIILVCRGRAYGPAIRLAESLAQRRISVDLAIINVSADDVSDESDPGEIDNYRSAFSSVANEHQVGLATPAILVANLKRFSMSGEEVVPDALAQEHARLRDLIEGRFDRQMLSAFGSARIEAFCSTVRRFQEYLRDKTRYMREKNAEMIANLNAGLMANPPAVKEFTDQTTALLASVDRKIEAFQNIHNMVQEDTGDGPIGKSMLSINLDPPRRRKVEGN